MFCKITSATINGIQGIVCNVEVDCSKGIPSFNMVGMLSSENKEAKSRVRIAIKNCGYNFDAKKITINISPANIHKKGTSLDLPICIALLYNMGEIKRYISNKIFMVGEIGLNGSIKKVNGIISMLDEAKKHGCENFFIPYENIREAQLVDGINIIGVSSLIDVVKKLNNHDFTSNVGKFNYIVNSNNLCNFSNIYSQDNAIRNAIIACCGKHNIIFNGSYGIGKTMIANAMLNALPPMDKNELIEVNKIYSSNNLTTGKLITTRPIRSPHHSITTSSLLGGGNYPSCGEISLAHNGILFLDEFGLYKKNVINNLREPLENGKITLTRSNYSVTYPCETMLIATMNGCECGEYPNMEKCRCSKSDLQKYYKKFSSSVLDRIDIITTLEKPTKKIKSIYDDLDIKKLVQDSWRLQKSRNKGKLNGQLNLNEIKVLGNFKKEAISYIDSIFSSLSLSMRGYARVLKISRTIADMEKSNYVEINHTNEAVLMERARQW